MMTTVSGLSAHSTSIWSCIRWSSLPIRASALQGEYLQSVLVGELRLAFVSFPPRVSCSFAFCVFAHPLLIQTWKPFFLPPGEAEWQLNE